MLKAKQTETLSIVKGWIGNRKKSDGRKHEKRLVVL